VVCGWEKIAQPTSAEWQTLRSNFYSGKMPITSVDELKALRLSHQIEASNGATKGKP
jgi:hypothetical protein